MYALDTQSARKADQTGSRITELGKYVGTFTQAEDITAGTGTKGVALRFESNGQSANLSLYTIKPDGEKIMGYQALMAIMTCMSLRNIAPKPGTVKVTLIVEGVRSDAGLIALTVYHDDSRRFLRKKGSHYVRRVEARAPETRICFIVPQPGVYALAVYHDANANQKLDRSGLGPPTEGFGFSNNASTLLGLPSFSAVRIRLADGAVTRIRLRYLKKGEVPAPR